MRTIGVFLWLFCAVFVLFSGSTSHAQGDLVVTSPLTLSSDQTFNNVTIRAGVSLTLGGHTLTVLGNLTVEANSSSAPHLILTNSADTLTVFGNVLFRGRNTLTEAVIRLHGNFTEDFNGATIQPGTPGTRFEFVGVNPQTVTFSSPGVNNAFFKNVAIFNTAGVTLATDVFIKGQLKLEEDAVLTQTGTSEVYFSVRLPDIDEGTYNVVNTRINGSVTMIEGFTLESSTNHLFIAANTSLTLNGHDLRMKGNLTVEANSSSAPHLILTNSADTLTVFGNVLFRARVTR
ncbi:MAG: hypothetical protein FJY97_01025 [candidate division Zixibacteria bacterium]|nr:hypothetical protein [candidate division Zixibacteria bacterium]